MCRFGPPKIGGVAGITLIISEENRPRAAPVAERQKTVFGFRLAVFGQRPDECLLKRDVRAWEEVSKKRGKRASTGRTDGQ